MFEMGLHGNWPGNYEVTKATQVEPAVILDLMGKLWFEASLRSVPWSPSADWSQGGPLIEKHRMDFTFDRDGLVFAYLCDENGIELPSSHKWEAFGPTHLIAACRAIVAAHLGEVVSVPAELVENK